MLAKTRPSDRGSALGWNDLSFRREARIGRKKDSRWNVAARYARTRARAGRDMLELRFMIERTDDASSSHRRLFLLHKSPNPDMIEPVAPGGRPHNGRNKTQAMNRAQSPNLRSRRALRGRVRHPRKRVHTPGHSVTSLQLQLELVDHGRALHLLVAGRPAKIRRLIAPSFDETFSTCSMNAPRGVLPEEAPRGGCRRGGALLGLVGIRDPGHVPGGCRRRSRRRRRRHLPRLDKRHPHPRNTSPSGYIASSAAPATEANEKSSTARIARPSE